MTAVFRHGGLRLYLLGLLDEAPRHGYEVIVELENRFMGSYSPSAGTVYPRLAKLEAEGLLEHEEVSGRKVYRITAAGRVELEAHRDELEDVKREVTASAAQAASELRREVASSAADLRAELLNAARGARREKRADSRVSQGSQSRAMAELARECARLSRDLLRVAATAQPEHVESAAARLRGVTAELTALLSPPG